MAELKYTFKNDILFKMLFVKNQDLLRQLVSVLLNIPFESIRDFSIRNPEIPPEQVTDKFCRLDMTMNLNGERVDLEIQVTNEGDYPERALYYWAREYSTALPKGGRYKDLPRTVVISIIDFKLFECEEFCSEIAPLEVTRHTRLSDKQSLYFFELPKIPKDIEGENFLELWLNLFNANTEEDLAKIAKLGVPIMNQAIDAFKNTASSPAFQEIERMRDKSRHAEASALGNAEERGLQKGLREGMQQGLQEGKLGVARSLMQMGLSIDTIMEATKLTLEELEKLRH
jgi:predicted transposase/invertase (TIGR01784 family)